MNGEDWTSYEFQPAPRDLLCQFRGHAGFVKSDGVFVGPVCTGYAKDFSPYCNVHGIEWKLTGIAREQLDRMPEEVRRQVMPLAGWRQMLNGLVGNELAPSQAEVDAMVAI